MAPASPLTGYKHKRVLITGGAGFIGSTLARALVKRGAVVTIIDSFHPDYGANRANLAGIEKKIVLNISDIRNKSAMDVLVRNQDIIFNLAGTLSHVDSMKDPFTDLDVNARSQLSLLESCREFNPTVKIVYAGTRNQYGKAKFLPVTEDHPMEPTDVNGINCIAGEWYHLLYHRIYGLKACSLRLSNTYGPRHQMKHSRQGVLNWFVRELMDGRKIKLMGGGTQIRDCTYVDDVVDAFLRVGIAKKVWGQAYNVGGYPASLIDFVKTVITVFGAGSYTSVPFPKDRVKIEIGDYIADYSKITAAVGWQPKTTLVTGIKKTIAYYAKHKKDYWT